MGISNEFFKKYPRTPHLFGSTGTSDDKHLNEIESLEFIQDPSLIVEEKLDGTNVGVHFTDQLELRLQCRGHLITAGMHPQYDLFKQWAEVMRGTFYEILGTQFVMFGEWVYATHSIQYTKLSHYFYEFDIFDKESERFLDYKTRMEMIEGTGVSTVPVLHTGSLNQKQMMDLIGRSKFESRFVHPNSGKTDSLMEGLYLRTEKNGTVTGRSKFVRKEFTQKVTQSEHWQKKRMECNQLDAGVDIWNSEMGG